MIRYNLFLLLIICSLSSFGQNKDDNENTSGLKSVIVTEQKFDGAASKMFKDAETYYDKKGNVIEEITYKEGKVDTHFKYQYDSNGNKIKEIEFTSGGKVKKTSDYKYQGNLRIEKTVTDENGKIKSKKTYKYEKY
jgi:antitoxin component YwqK of YwqJK toxin-antitoxin module